MKEPQPENNVQQCLIYSAATYIFSTILVSTKLVLSLYQNVNLPKATHKLSSSIISQIFSSMDTYIHNWSLHFFSQYYALVSHSTHVACDNFIHKWQGLVQKVDSEQQIWKPFHSTFIFTQRIWFLRESSLRNIFFILRLVGS